MKYLAGIAASTLMLILASGPALALDSSFKAMSKSGKHQFYVWCTEGKSKVESAEGANAKDAQAKIAAAAGASCWPVWQGFVS